MFDFSVPVYQKNKIQTDVTIFSPSNLDVLEITFYLQTRLKCKFNNSLKTLQVMQKFISVPSKVNNKNEI